MKKYSVLTAAAVLLFAFAAVSAFGQDFQKNYSIQNGGRISISNVSGDIAVTGYNGSAVVVSAYKEGRDRDAVEIVDESSGNTVALKVRYPFSGSHDASVRFAVQVPRGASFQFDSNNASGDIEISDVAGDVNAKTASGDLNIRQIHGTIHASTASGDVKVLQVVGMVTAHTASGDIEVELSSVEGSGQLSFSSASGDITVKVPAQLNADVDLSTASGSANSDFPLQLDDREGHGKRLYGRLGSGATPLKISAASGDVRLVRF